MTDDDDDHKPVGMQGIKPLTWFWLIVASGIGWAAIVLILIGIGCTFGIYCPG